MAHASATPGFFAPRRHLFAALAGAVGLADAVPQSMRRAGNAQVDTGLVDAADTATAKAAPQPNLSTPPAVTRWLTKATFGVAPTDIAAFNALGGNDDARWTAWVERQLVPGAIDDSACDARVASAGFTTLGKTVQQLWADHRSQTSNYYLRMLPFSEIECMTLIRQTYSQRQLAETLADFWHDHFSVFGTDYDGGPVFVPFDRDVIRPNVLGNFRAMLESVAKSTTMMYYLDLYSSTRAGPNENFARELFELHTLGAENYGGVLFPDDPSLGIGQLADGSSIRLKYVDNDVYEATSALTGWTLKNGHWQFPTENDGTFTYRDDWHDQYNKYVLNRYFPAYRHQADGTKLFDILAAHPGTARYVCGKLVRRFVDDAPPPALVAAAAQTFMDNWQAPDQIARVVRVILNSAEFKTAWGSRMRRPAVATVAALRSLGANFTPAPDNTSAWTTTEEFLGRLQQTGNRLFFWPAPNGYPDKQVAWASSGALGMTFRLLARLTEMRTVNGQASSPFLADVVAQTATALPGTNFTAQNIAGFWCDRLLGYRPEPVFSVATNFMRQNVTATTQLLNDENWNGPILSRHYNQSRLRTMVALILCSPEFLRR